MSEAAPPSVINLKSLRWSLAFLLVASSAAALTYFGLTQLHRKSQTAHQQALAQRSDVATRLARAKDDERDMRARIARYSEIIERGRTLPERRLEWIETLKSTKESRKLLGLEYEIAPQRRLDEKAGPAGGYDFLASTVRIEIPLLHENDLFGVLTDLGTQIHALVSARYCLIERLPASAKPNSPLLKALCELDWITLEEKT